MSQADAYSRKRKRSNEDDQVFARGSQDLQRDIFDAHEFFDLSKQKIVAALDVLPCILLPLAQIVAEYAQHRSEREFKCVMAPDNTRKAWEMHCVALVCGVSPEIVERFEFNHIHNAWCIHNQWVHEDRIRAELAKRLKMAEQKVKDNHNTLRYLASIVEHAVFTDL